jgi:hypothetical protein
MGPLKYVYFKRRKKKNEKNSLVVFSVDIHVGTPPRLIR